MEYIEAVNEFEKDSGSWRYKDGMPSIFLAGGITDCPDWQKEIATLLKDEDVILLNPRRKDFPMDDPTASYKQIKWEYEQLRKATAIIFWFAKETMCPIVLFELGTWVVSGKDILIGMDKEYERKQDVQIQTVLEKGDTEFYYSIEELAQATKKLIQELKP